MSNTPQGTGRFRAKTLHFLAKAELFNASLKRLCATESNMAVHQRITTNLLDVVHLSYAGPKYITFPCVQPL